MLIIHIELMFISITVAYSAADFQDLMQTSTSRFLEMPQGTHLSLYELSEDNFRKTQSCVGLAEAGALRCGLHLDHCARTDLWREICQEPVGLER